MSRVRGLFAGLAGLLVLAAVPAQAATAPQATAQGKDWTDAERAHFYSRDQGSQLIPLAWLRALKQSDGSPFFPGLERYGYLGNPFDKDGSGLPIGFTQAPTPSGQMVGMTCAACHVRDFVVKDTTWRVDGAPGGADFGAFVADLDAAVGQALASDQAFAAFAGSVLGDAAKDPTRAEILKAEVRYWSTRFHALIGGTLAHAPPWGPTRLDAFSVIYNTVSGLSIGPAPTYLVPRNIQTGFAPVRYPVLWDSGKQDRIQWTGIAENGTKPLALARSTTEILGVFGTFRPVRTPGALGPVDRDYLLHNSASFSAFDDLETTIGKMGSPAWPFGLDTALAAKGKAIFDRPTADGGCVACHGLVMNGDSGLWKTPLVDVGTDRAAWRMLDSKVEDTASMKGAAIPPSFGPLKASDTNLDLLKVSVGGSLLGLRSKLAVKSPVTSLLYGYYQELMPSAKVPRAKLVTNGYEARVLFGIWAAPPYLHDGSVPTLADLLEPADKRPHRFAIGTHYDPARVGLATEQPPGTFVLETTGCDDLESSRSNCGHDYGTKLPPEDKKALLEYLKSL